MAKAVDVNVETIRYDQCRGHQRYSEQEGAAFTKWIQLLGFRPKEIEILLRLEKDGSCGETHNYATHKLAPINGKITHLRRVRRVLKNPVRQCKAENQSGAGPLLNYYAGT